jgi:DNA mismatch repair protein MutS
VIPGKAERSYGLNVAQLAGLPSGVLDRATQILHQLTAPHSTPQRRPAHAS